MPNIFISHSTKDNDKTREIADMLKDADFDVWVDFDSIHDGTRWVHEIEKGIDSCSAVLVVWSKAAKQSEWVEKECLYALDSQKPMFIARVENARLRLYLINIQFTDCTTNLFKGVTNLIETLKDTLNTPDDNPNYPEHAVSSEPMEDNFFPYVEQLPHGEAAMWVAKDLYHWAKDIADEIEFGGSQNPTYHVKIDLPDDKQATVFSIWAYPKTPSTQIPFDYLKDVSPYTNKTNRTAVLKQVNLLLPDEMQFAEDKADRRPSIPLHYLSTAEKLEGYKQIIKEMIHNLRA